MCTPSRPATDQNFNNLTVRQILNVCGRIKTNDIDLQSINGIPFSHFLSPVPIPPIATNIPDTKLYVFGADGAFTAPKDGSILVRAWSGGGGGGSGNQDTKGTTFRAGSGGGSGAYLELYQQVSNGQSFSIIIGQGGAGGSTLVPPGDGLPGGSTIFDSFVITGGAGGVRAIIPAPNGGAGGVSPSTTSGASGTQIFGINGQQGEGVSSFLTGDPMAPSVARLGGQGASAPLGGIGGFAPGLESTLPGNPGTVPGGGGGGGSSPSTINTTTDGGSGANGLVLVYFTSNR